MISWVRVSTKIPDDPSVARIASGLKIKLPMAVGLVVGVFCKLPDHARDGALAPVPDSLLEKWAGWEGKTGRFAALFRAELCDAAGVVRNWERYNGAPMREAEADVERKRSARKKKDASGDCPADTSRNVREASGGFLPLRDVTGKKLSAPNRAERVSSPRKSSESTDGTPAPEGARAANAQVFSGPESVSGILPRVINA